MSKLILGMNVAPIDGKMEIVVEKGDVIFYVSSPVGIVFMLDCFRLTSQNHPDKKQRRRARRSFETLMRIIMTDEEVN